MPNYTSTVTMQFRADTTQAKREMNDLQRQFKELLSSTNLSSGINKGITSELKEAQNAAAALQLALQRATNVRTGSFDLREFDNSIKRSGYTIEELGQQMSRFDVRGTTAFSNLTEQIIRAEQPLRRTSQLLDSAFRTMANSVKWQLSATAVYGIMDAISGAYQYAVDLDSSLNDIRIVSGQSAEQMAAFAEYANQAAKNLSTTTVDYADAALIYYQQGLAEEQVKERTDLTIQMANVTGDTVQEVSDQLTAVWNNFYDGSYSLEYYIDVMTKLGAATASSSSEIAEGLQDFSAIADMIGLSFDYAATAIATTTSVSRQSANVVGTSFRSIFARIQGLMMGETLEDGVDLNKYSNALAKVGINVLDATGNLRDMNSILDEMGEKWSTLSQTQQTALAQTVAGVWQYNNLVTLMNNWDTFQQNLDIAQNSAGTLEEQSKIYEESWRAASARVKSNLEDIYNSILDSDAFKNLLDGIATAINGLDSFIDSIGGLPGVLALIGSIGTKVFREQLANGIKFAGENLFSLTGASKEYYNSMKESALNETISQIAKEYPLMGTKAWAENMRQSVEYQELYNNKQGQLNETQKQYLDILKQSVNVQQQLYQEAADTQDRVLANTETTVATARGNAIPTITDDEWEKHVEPLTSRLLRPGEVTKDIDLIKKELQDFVNNPTDGKKITGFSEEVEAAFSRMQLNSSELIGKNQKQIEAYLKGNSLNISHYYNKIADQLETIFDPSNDKIFSSKLIEKFQIDSVRTMIDELRNLGDQAKKVNESGSAAASGMQNLIDVVNKLTPTPLDRMTQGMVTFGNAIANLTIAVLSLQTAWDTLNNQDASFLDKLLSVLMALGIIIPTAIELFNAFNLLKDLDVKATIAQITATEGHILSLNRQKKAMDEVAASQENLTRSKQKDTQQQQKKNLVDKTEDGLDLFMSVPDDSSIVKDSGKKQGRIAGTLGKITESVGKLKNAFTTFLPVLSRATLVFGAITAATALYNEVQRATELATRDWDQYNLDQTNTAVTNLTQSYNDLTTELQNYQNAVSTYETARSELNSLTEGTEEYKSKLEEANDAAITLIQTYNEDITGADWEIIDGEIIISPESIDALDHAMEIDLDNARAASLIATQNQTQARTAANVSNGATEFADANATLNNFTSGTFGGYGEAQRAFEVMVDAVAKDFDAANTKESIVSILEQNLPGFTAKGNQGLIDALYLARKDIQDLAGEVSNNTAAQKNTYQQNANAELERLGLDNQGLEEVGGRLYTNLVESISENTINNLGSNYKDILQKYFDVSLTAANDAKYNEEDQVVTYTDEQGNLQELTFAQIEATVAATEASTQFEESITKLNSEMQQLSKSTDVADKSLLSFLQSGNLESLTRNQYDQISSEVEYDQDTGKYNENKVDAILGLTGTLEENNERAALYGYTSAEAMREAFVEGLDVDWELPEGLKGEINQFLSLGNVEEIRENFKTLGEEAGQSYIDGLNLIYDSIDWSKMSAEDAQAVWDNIVNYNWQDGSIEDFQNALNNIGAEIDYTSEAWTKFTDSAQSAFHYVVPSVEELYTNFQEIHEIIDDIELGSILTEEDYQLLTKYNDELGRYFIQLANGDYQMIGDPLDLQQDVAETERNEYIDSINGLKRSIEDIDQDTGVIDYLNVLNDATRDLGQTAQSTTGAWGSLVDQQLKALEAANYDEDRLASWRKGLESDNLDSGQLRDISEAIESVDSKMQSSISTIQEYDKQLQAAMNSLAMQSDAEEASKLFKEGTINYAAYAGSANKRIQEDRYENVDLEEVEEYSDYLQEAADSSELLSDELVKNEEASEEVALATIRMNNGMDELVSNWEDWSDILKNSSKESQEYAEVMTSVKSALSDVLGVSEDFISNDFVTNHLNDIEAAVMGDTAAIDRLKMAMAQEVVVKATFDDTELQQKALAAHNTLVANMPDLEVGATLSTGDFLTAAQGIIDTANMTVEEAQSYFNALGYEPVFETEPVTTYTSVPEYTNRVTGFSIGYTDEEGKKHFAPGFKTTTVVTGYKRMPTTIDAPILYNDKGEKTTDGTGRPRLKSLVSTGGHSAATRSPSIGSNMSNYAPRNAGGTQPYTPDGSGGGGSGGSDSKEEEEPTPAEPMEYTQIAEVVDRYYEITDSIDDMTDALDDASDAADRLYGKDRIAAMEQQRDLMAQQQKLLKQYRSEIEAYLAKDKAALENNEYGIHFTFDADGDITNYTQIMTDLWNQLHTAEQTYNSFATKEEQDAYQESTLDPLNKKIEEIKNLVDTYDSTQDLLVDVDNQIRDALNEWQDKNYEILTYKIELQIEINDMEQERLDYYLNKYEDDFYKMAESMALTGDSFPLLTNNLETYKNEMNQLNQAYHNGEISQDAFIEGMKEVNSGLLDNMNALVDLDREMLEYYENTLDSAEDKLGDFTDQLEHQMSILEHYQNVLSLIGKEQDYQMVGSVLQGQFSVAQDQLAAQERWVETLKNQMADIQSDLLSAVDEKEREALNEQLLLVTQRLNEAEESVNDLRESVLELAQSILENDLAKYAQQLSENLVEGLGFGNLDEYLDTIDKLNTSQEEYLTTTNKVYETNKLIRQAQEDMAENDSLLAKQRYQEYIDYVEQLQEQGRLSEYELRIAQARYEVLQAQIALEEAQNAKDSMRLVRDSQGNYNYVYTANQDNISQAQQALEDAENNLYNIGLEGAQNYQDKYAQILEEAFNAFKDLSEQYKNGEVTSEEDFNQKRLELQNYYYNRLKDIQDLYYIAHDLLVNESYTNEADYIFAGIGNLEDFKDATDQYLQDCNNAFDKWQENTEVATDSVGNGMGDLQDHIQDVTDTSSDLTNQIQDSLIPVLEDELEAVRDMTNLWLSHRDALYETLQAYEELQQGAQNTISNAAGVQPGGVLPNIPEEYQADIGAIMAAYLQQGGSINDDLFQQLWNKRNEKVEWLAAHGYSSDYWGSYGEETIKGFEELVSGGGDQDWYDYAANMYTIEQIREFLKQMGLPTFKTGGYTGEWGPSGRLAIIHEKELILNQNDTNSLINIIREYGKLKSTNMDILNLSFNDIITKFKSIINKINLNDQNQIAAQQVSIEASFPNVSVASEIEDAFNDLLNRAAQYASLNRTNY